MDELSYKHIELIKAEVYNAGISCSHLQYDLIDHICCDIENEMQKGLAFEKAYAKVKQQFSSDGLQKIQEETLFLIDKKYRIMKTTMKLFGVIAPIIIAFGTLFKIEHWSGAGILLAVGFFLLAFVFLPSAVYVSYREVNNNTLKLAHVSGFIAGFLVSISFLFKIQHWPATSIIMLVGILVTGLIFLPAVFVDKIKSAVSGKQRMIYLIGWLGSFIYLTGFLFKVNHWPGASILLISGSLIFLVIAFPMYVFNKYKNDESVSASFIFITVAVVWIIIPTMLISLNISRDALKGFTEIQDLTTYHIQYVTSKNNRLYEKLHTTSVSGTGSVKSLIENTKKHSDEVFEYVERVKRDINGVSESSSESYGISNIMFGKDNDGEARKIKEKIANYRSYLISVLGNNQSKVRIIESILSTKEQENSSDEYKTWEDYHLKGAKLITAFNKLSWLQDNVRIAENIVLQEFIGENSK